MPRPSAAGPSACCTARARSCCRTRDGQIVESHSISAGLDYPGVGPEHAHLAEIGRAEFRSITDAQAMDAFALLSRTEGIIPAIESAHAVAGAVVLAKEIGPGGIVLINVSGRGDKDMETAMNWFGLGDQPSGERHAMPSPMWN